jgi:hypothetical protein
LEVKKERNAKAINYLKNSLGGYLGPLEYGYEELFSKGLSRLGSSFSYLKTVSDFAGRETGSVFHVQG